MREEVEKADFLRSRNFSIISCKARIFSLYFIYIDVMAVVMAKVTVLKIEYYIAGSTVSGDMSEISF